MNLTISFIHRGGEKNTACVFRSSQWAESIKERLTASVCTGMFMCINKKIDIGRKRRTCGWCSAGFSSSRRCHSCGCIHRKDPTCPSDPHWAPGRKTAGYTRHHSVKETLTLRFLWQISLSFKFILGLRHSSCSAGQEWTLRLIFRLKNEKEKTCKRNLEVQLKAPVQIFGEKKRLHRLSNS